MTYKIVLFIDITNFCLCSIAFPASFSDKHSETKTEDGQECLVGSYTFFHPNFMETTNFCISSVENQLQMLKILSPAFSGLLLISCNQHIQIDNPEFQQLIQAS